MYNRTRFQLLVFSSLLSFVRRLCDYLASYHIIPYRSGVIFTLDIEIGWIILLSCMVTRSLYLFYSIRCIWVSNFHALI
jgi:hypothetical protein